MRADNMTEAGSGPASLLRREPDRYYASLNPSRWKCRGVPMGKPGVRSVEPRGADLVVRALRNAGTQAYLLALRQPDHAHIRRPSWTGISSSTHVRQEAAAVHMADAWGRLTDNPGVALVTAGPGSPTRCPLSTWRGWPSRRSCSFRAARNVGAGRGPSKRCRRRAWQDPSRRRRGRHPAPRSWAPR